MEPSWDALRDHLGAMTVRELRGIGRRWFNGTLGGASGKGRFTHVIREVE